MELALNRARQRNLLIQMSSRQIRIIMLKSEGKVRSAGENDYERKFNIYTWKFSAWPRRRAEKRSWMISPARYKLKSTSSVTIHV
jgi:hypothetical protein